MTPGIRIRRWGSCVKQRRDLAEGGAKDALDEGKDEHVKEAGGDAGGGPEVGDGGEGEGDAGGGESEAGGAGKGTAVDDIAALHNGAGEPHPHPDEEVMQMRHRPRRRRRPPAGRQRWRRLPRRAAVAEAPMGREKGGGKVEAEAEWAGGGHSFLWFCGGHANVKKVANRGRIDFYFYFDKKNNY